MTTQDDEEIVVPRHRRTNAIESCYAFPDFQNLNLASLTYQKDFSNAMNYAHYTFEMTDLREYAREYSKGKYDIMNVPDFEFHHVGVLCWILNNSGEISPQGIEDLHVRLEQLSKTYPASIDAGVKVAKPDITDIIIGDLEGFIDDAINDSEHDKNVEDVFGDKPISFKEVHEHFRKQLDQFDDPEYNEYFNKTSKKYKELIKAILDAADKLSNTKRKTKSVRTPRKIVPAKMVKRVNYMKEFAELGLKSVHPERIVGASLVWVYNTKTRRLYKFVAKNNTGFLVKGTSILNYDEDKSVMKTLRKPKDILDKIIGGGKVDQRKTFEDVRAVEKPVSPRISKECIIVKVS